MLFRGDSGVGALSAAVVVAAVAYLAGVTASRLGPDPSPAKVESVEIDPGETAGDPGALAGDPGQRGGDSSLLGTGQTAGQPVTGPGRPPLAKAGGGPFGSHRTTGGDYVALTFDDGPDPRWTPQVLQLLRDYAVTATFCVVGQLATAYPDLVRAIAADGHTLCNHSWGHDIGLGGRSRAEIRADLQRTSEAIRAAAPDARISYYRQPGGAWTSRVIEVAAGMGMSSLHWDVDPRDWQRPGAGRIASMVTSSTRHGSIVLLHDGGGERAGTVRALRTILRDLTGRVALDGLPPGVDPPRRHGRELPLKPGQI